MTDEPDNLMPDRFKSCLNIKCVALLSLTAITLSTSGVALSLLITTSSNTALYTGLIASNMGILVGLIASPKRLLRN